MAGLGFLEQYRNQTYKLGKVKTLKDALQFVAERGLIFFWPIKDIELPSLWASVAGNRPVPSNHNDPAHVTWGWKDSMLGEKKWYYAKVLRRKGTLISLDLAPCFYALSQNYGEPQEDYIAQFQEGKLSPEAKRIYEVLLDEGPIHTQLLRRKAGLKMYPFSKGLDELQADFKVLPVKVTEAGRWKYAYVYDCVHRHYPELPDQARGVGSLEARAAILRAYFQSVGAALVADILKLFGWEMVETLEALETLVGADFLVGRENPKPDSGFVLSKLMKELA